MTESYLKSKINRNRNRKEKKGGLEVGLVSLSVGNALFLVDPVCFCFI